MATVRKIEIPAIVQTHEPMGSRQRSQGHTVTLRQTGLVT